ncbi:MAG TPA: hypothetical protein VK952_04865, partial [Methylotenera sp.]|nr:hypothetical protein [Methylotenera sp.]
MTKLYLIVLLTCLATACVSPATQTNGIDKMNSPVKVNPTKNGDATEFLTFAEIFSNSSADLQKQALIEANRALALNANDLLHRMKLVMIYGLPSSSLADTAKAQNLLQQILQEGILANSQLAFSNLLFDHLVAINKLTKFSNGDPKRLETLQQKNEALQMKLDATQHKLEAAQQKLDELKKIE